MKALTLLAARYATSGSSFHANRKLNGSKHRVATRKWTGVPRLVAYSLTDTLFPGFNATSASTIVTLVSVNQAAARIKSHWECGPSNISRSFGWETTYARSESTTTGRDVWEDDEKVGSQTHLIEYRTDIV